MHLTADSPELTAYVLGGLAPAERATVEAAIGSDPALAQAVAEIRATVALAEPALRAEPCPTLTPEQRETVLAAARAASQDRIDTVTAALLVLMDALLLVRAIVVATLPALGVLGLATVFVAPFCREMYDMVFGARWWNLPPATAAVLWLSTHWTSALAGVGLAVLLPSALDILLRRRPGPHPPPAFDVGLERVLQWVTPTAAVAVPLGFALTLAALLDPLVRPIILMATHGSL